VTYTYSLPPSTPSPFLCPPTSLPETDRPVLPVTSIQVHFAMCAFLEGARSCWSSPEHQAAGHAISTLF
jgi:hypothetical protein